jgi:uncharacterized protein YndB with AHSA1/START domain
MEQKTKIDAEDDKQELRITREFDLPLELLFKAYVEPEIVEQWMGTKVVKLESKKHGSYQFVTTDPKGNIHGFNGTIHELVPNWKIIRTFEMENTLFGVQLEFYEFVSASQNTVPSPFLRCDLIIASNLALAHERVRNSEYDRKNDCDCQHAHQQCNQQLSGFSVFQHPF